MVVDRVAVDRVAVVVDRVVVVVVVVVDLVAPSSRLRRHASHRQDEPGEPAGGEAREADGALTEARRADERAGTRLWLAVVNSRSTRTLGFCVCES